MKWLHFILSHSIFVAICAVSLVFQTVQLLKLESSIFIYGFVFFATLCSYNFYWVMSRFSFTRKRSMTELLKNNTTAISLLSFSAAGMLFCFLHTSLSVHIIATAI